MYDPVAVRYETRLKITIFFFDPLSLLVLWNRVIDDLDSPKISIPITISIEKIPIPTVTLSVDKHI